MTNKKKKKKKLLIALFIAILCAALVFFAVQCLHTSSTSAAPSAESTAASTTAPASSTISAAESTASAAESTAPAETAESIPAEDTAAASSSDGCSTAVLDAQFTDTSSLLLIANKKYKLPEGYIPEDLVDAGIPCTNGSATMRAEAAEQLQKMYADALKDGVSLAISSAYRSEQYQATLYNGYVASYGQAEADSISSRPGYSDHQTGLAADFVEGGSSDFTDAFENTSSGQWLMTHAHLYGFIMRYPNGKQAVTGYDYEPWHYRYIGIENAEALYSTSPDETFEEYYQIDGGDYCQS